MKKLILLASIILLTVIAIGYSVVIKGDFFLATTACIMLILSICLVKIK